MRSIDEFWSHIRSGDPGECWPWTRAVNACGYGIVNWHGRQMLTHRVAYLLAAGSDPGEMRVLHSCDNPPCCNPAHLSLGTQADNVRDCLAKGRFRSNRGEDHNLAFLTEEQVLAIRRLKAETGMRHIDIAARFGITPNHVSLICRRRIWKHLPDEAAA